MTPITAIAATEHLADLRRVADARHLAKVETTPDATPEEPPRRFCCTSRGPMTRASCGGLPSSMMPSRSRARS